MAQKLLSATRVERAKPKDKPYRLNDGEGLTLYVAPSGVRSWQFRYSILTADKNDPTNPPVMKQQTATLGKYPDVSLADARDAAAAARAMAADGKHVNVERRKEHARKATARAQTFAKVRKAWLEDEAERARWSGKYVRQVAALFENHLKPLDPLPVSEIVAAMTAPLVRQVGKSAPMMEEKVERALHAVMNFAVTDGQIERNPLPPRRPARVDRRNYPAVTDLPGVGAILRAARASDPCKGIVRAHELAVFTAQRISEVVGARWAEFDLHTGTWAIPRDRMKRKDEARGPHLVPLPPALLARLREWRAADGGEAAAFVCPAPRDAGKHITPEGCEKWMREALGLGGMHSPHSWRSAFKTITSDAGKDTDAIEAQLDHVIGSKVASAYDRAKRLELRRPLMEWYERTLIAARDGAEVVSIERERVPA
jgi:integrase